MARIRNLATECTCWKIMLCQLLDVSHMMDKNYERIGTNRWMHSGKHLCPAKRHYQETAMRVCCKPRPQSLCWSWVEDLIPQVGPKSPTQERNSAS
jgi:hypothetical protein